MYTLFFQEMTKCHTIVSNKSRSINDFKNNEASIIINSTLQCIRNYLRDLRITSDVMVVSK